VRRHAPPAHCRRVLSRSRTMTEACRPASHAGGCHPSGSRSEFEVVSLRERPTVVSPALPMRSVAGTGMETTAHPPRRLHAFYASVEQLLDPSLRGNPLPWWWVASRLVRSQGIWSRRRHVGTAERASLPATDFVVVHSRTISGWACRHQPAPISTPLVERISLTRPRRCRGLLPICRFAAEIATAVRRRVRTDIGLPISIGWHATKHLAKIARNGQTRRPGGRRPGERASFPS